MKISLNIIDKESIIRKLNTGEYGNSISPIQYADFNVINYLYENNYTQTNLNNLFLYPDSTAVYFYIKCFLKRSYKNIISTNLQYSLLSELDSYGSSIYLFGDSDSILEKVICNIKNTFSSLNVVGSCNGFKFKTDEIISDINKSKVDVLLVGLGVGRQEKWLSENYKNLNVKIIISVGGWFQYLAKNKKRAPIFLRKNHLEWLHKLVVEFPRIWKRYFWGIPKFYYRVITKKIIIRVNEK